MSTGSVPDQETGPSITEDIIVLALVAIQCICVILKVKAMSEKARARQYLWTSVCNQK